MVSGRYFLPKEPLLCLKRIPACEVTSVNWIGREGRADPFVWKLRAPGVLLITSAANAIWMRETAIRLSMFAVECFGFLSRTGSFGFGYARVAPDFEQVSGGPNQEKRVEGGINAMHQAQDHLRQRDQKDNQNLSFF